MIATSAARTWSTAKCAASSSGTFGARKATRSPGAMPARTSAPARRPTSSAKRRSSSAARRRRQRSRRGRRAASLEQPRAASSDRGGPAARRPASRRFYTRFRRGAVNLGADANCDRGHSGVAARMRSSHVELRSSCSRARLALARRGLDGPDPNPVRVGWSGPRASDCSSQLGALDAGHRAAARAARRVTGTCGHGSARAAPSRRASAVRSGRKKPRERMRARSPNPEAATASALPGRWPRTGVLRHREESRSKTCGV